VKPNAVSAGCTPTEGALVVRETQDVALIPTVTITMSATPRTKMPDFLTLYPFISWFLIPGTSTTEGAFCAFRAHQAESFRPDGRHWRGPRAS